MESQTEEFSQESQRAQRRAEREQRRRARRRQKRIRFLKKAVPCLLVVFAAAATALAVRHGRSAAPAESAAAASSASVSAAVNAQGGGAEAETPFSPSETGSTAQVGDAVVSKCAVLIDADSGAVLAEKNADEVISPASMTKILTLLVAAEQMPDPDASMTITPEITDYCYVHDCSAVGFSKEETVSVRDLFYGTVLPSGADAALGLAFYTAGSQEAFVERMNQKLDELGLSETAHFTNCVGLYNENHFCTVKDMAVLLKTAVENEWCRQVLSARTYTTSSTAEHPEGIQLSNWFLRRIEDKDCGNVHVQCAKTGFVTQAGSCAASYAESDDGHAYLCVTAGSTSSWRCIYDHVALYKQFT